MATATLPTLGGFPADRWLYGLCWTGTERPGVLFARVTGWLLTHKVLAAGAQHTGAFDPPDPRPRREKAMAALGRGLTTEQRTRLNRLLTIPEGSRHSWLEQLRSGPTRVSGPALAGRSIVAIGPRPGYYLATRPAFPFGRIAVLARFAHRAKAAGYQPDARRSSARHPGRVRPLPGSDGAG